MCVHFATGCPSITDLEVPVDVICAQEDFHNMVHFKIACAHDGFVVDSVQAMSSQKFNPHDHRDRDIDDDDDDFDEMHGGEEDDGIDFENLSEPLQGAFEDFLQECGITDEFSEA